MFYWQTTNSSMDFEYNRWKSIQIMVIATYWSKTYLIICKILMIIYHNSLRVCSALEFNNLVPSGSQIKN